MYPCRAEHRTGQAATVRFRTANGTAKAGVDYEHTEGLLEFPADATSAAIEVSVFEADEVERDESFSVELFDAKPEVAVELERSTVRALHMLPCSPHITRRACV